MKNERKRFKKRMNKYINRKSVIMFMPGSEKRYNFEEFNCKKKKGKILKEKNQLRRYCCCNVVFAKIQMHRYTVRYSELFSVVSSSFI